MSVGTHALRISFILLLLAVFMDMPLNSGAAWATEYERAQAELAQAYNDYYRALKAVPNISKEKAKELSDKFLSPANAKVAKALENETRVAARKAAETPEPSASGTYEQRAPATTFESVEVGGGGGDEAGLDGSDVPKEIEFPGPPPTSSKQ